MLSRFARFSVELGNEEDSGSWDRVHWDCGVQEVAGLGVAAGGNPTAAVPAEEPLHSCVGMSSTRKKVTVIAVPSEVR